MSTHPPVDFDEPRLAAAIEQLSTEEIDALPFGVIRVDDAGIVRFYSRGEAELSGYGARPTLGRGFFTEIAPCMNTEQFKGRIDAALGSGTLDIEFGFVGDFSDRERELRVRIQSASEGGYWIFNQRV